MAEISVDLKTREILRQRLKIVFGCRLHEIGHARVVAARFVPETQHLREQIFLPLSCKPRCGAVALKMIEVTAAAAN